MRQELLLESEMGFNSGASLPESFYCQHGYSSKPIDRKAWETAAREYFKLFNLDSSDERVS
jgi:hypothetical protein